MENDKILLFIPMYNCEKQIPRVLEKLALWEDAGEHLGGVLVVDNRSADGSVRAAAEGIRTLSVPAMVVRNDDNYGLGGSHKVAFSYALDHGFRGVIVLHGDDQGDVRDIIPFLSEAERWDSMLGSRFSRGSRLCNYSKFRIFGNHVFNALFSAVTGRRVEDLGSGLNYYSTSYLASGFYLPFPNDLTFNVYLLLYGIHSGSRFRFFPLSWREEDQVSNARFMKQSKRMLGLMGQYLFSRKKLFSQRENEYSRIRYTFQVAAENGQEGTK